MPWVASSQPLSSWLRSETEAPFIPHSWSGSPEPLPLQAVPRVAMAAQGKTPGIWDWSELTPLESGDSGGGSDHLSLSPMLHRPQPQTLALNLDAGA